ncbi:MAG TPA: hypothetical protein VFS33_08815 [Gemmatimonadales bacterium]|nr:hypothetical protein [Gemmatimonadales bacterium]
MISTLLDGSGMGHDRLRGDDWLARVLHARRTRAVQSEAGPGGVAGV